MIGGSAVAESDMSPAPFEVSARLGSAASANYERVKRAMVGARCMRRVVP